MPEVLDQPVQKEAVVLTPPPEPPQAAEASSFAERMAQARAKSQKDGGVEGEAVPVAKAPVQSTEQKVVETKPEVKAEAKVETKVEAKTESKSSLADAITKIKEGNLEEKPEARKEEEKVDLSKLTKEQKEAYTYKQLRQEAEQAKALREELDGLKGKLNGTDIDSLKKELDDIKKVAEERQQRLAAYDVTQSAKYQNEVALPQKKIFEELQKTSKDFGLPWKDFVDAMEQPTDVERESALSKVMAAAEKEMNPLTQLRVVSSINEYLQRQEFGDKLIQNSIPALEAMKREENAKVEASKKQNESEFTRVSGIVFDHIVSDETLEQMPFLKGEDGKLDMDKAKQVRGVATFGDTPHHIRALQAYSTELLPMALEENKSLRDKLKEREERISQLSGLSPSVKQSDNTTMPAFDASLTLEQKIAQIRRSQGQ